MNTGNEDKHGNQARYNPSMATKQDIANMATKQDILNMATKQDIVRLENRMDANHRAL